jgi:hypothetical protein
MKGIHENFGHVVAQFQLTQISTNQITASLRACLLSVWSAGGEGPPTGQVVSTLRLVYGIDMCKNMHVHNEDSFLIKTCFGGLGYSSVPSGHCEVLGSIVSTTKTKEFFLTWLWLCVLTKTFLIFLTGEIISFNVFYEIFTMCTSIITEDKKGNVCWRWVDNAEYHIWEYS